MKSPGHADPSSNPITVNIYGLPDLVQRYMQSGTMSKTLQYVGHYEVAYPNQKSFCCSVGWTFTENDDQGAI